VCQLHASAVSVHDKDFPVTHWRGGWVGPTADLHAAVFSFDHYKHIIIIIIIIAIIIIIIDWMP
jgi:hypothetical protein